MALTGDLAQLHITDIIQLIHTTRQSGNLSIEGPRGESRIIFSNGYIVGANHLNSRVRIGSVLVAMKSHIDRRSNISPLMYRRKQAVTDSPWSVR